MKKLRKFHLLVVVSISLIILLFPGLTKAEIATTTDWIGLFPASKATNTACPTECPNPPYTGFCDCKNATVPTSTLPDGHTWVYTSSCRQDPDPIPQLARDGIGSNPAPCNFVVNPSPAPGPNYEYRMYANNQETADALLSSIAVTAVTAPSPTPIPIKITGRVYNIDGDFTVNSDITVTTLTGLTGIIFVKGNLAINHDLTYNYSDGGLVFVVKGNITIAPTVALINAVLISSGHIYTAATAGSTCSHLSLVLNSPQLVVNGSLVSLSQDPSSNIEFCRSLPGAANNTTPAEVVNQQPKYLVILRNLYADTLQKWSEIQ